MNDWHCGSSTCFLILGRFHKFPAWNYRSHDKACNHSLKVRFEIEFISNHHETISIDNNTIEQLIHDTDTTITSKWLLLQYSRWCCLINGRVSRYHDRYDTINDQYAMNHEITQQAHSRSRKNNVQQVYRSQNYFEKDERDWVWLDRNETNERMNERMNERIYEWTKTSETKQIRSEVSKWIQWQQQRLLSSYFPLAGQRIIEAQARKQKVDKRVSAKPRSRLEHLTTTEGFLLLMIFLLILENWHSQKTAQSLQVLD